MSPSSIFRVLSCCLALFLVAAITNAGNVLVTEPQAGESSRLVKEPVVMAVPVRSGTVVNDHVFAAWMSAPKSADDPDDVQIRVALSQNGGASWGGTTTLAPPPYPSFNQTTVFGDPFFAVDSLSGTAYLVHVAQGDNSQNEIALWSSPVSQSNWTFEDHLCHTPFENTNDAYAKIDKPSIAVSPAGTVYVAHFTTWAGKRSGSIHVHKRLSPHQWWSPGTGPGTGQFGGFYLEPPVGSEYQSPILIAPDESNLYIVMTQWLNGQERIVVAHVSDQGNIFTIKSVEAGPFADRGVLGNTNLNATTNVMAAYSPATSSIGIVWHTRVDGNVNDRADVKFVSYNTASAAFGTVTNFSAGASGSQWTPGIYNDPAGIFLVTYYEAKTPNVLPFSYEFKAALVNTAGQRLGCSDVVLSENASVPADNLYKGQPLELGEYQGVWYSSNTDSWYASFVQVKNGTRSTYVARIPPIARATCARARVWPIPYTIHRNAILHINTEQYDTPAALDPPAYDVQWRDAAGNLLSTSPTFDQRVPQTMDLYLRVLRRDNAACDVLVVHVTTIEPEAACNAVAGLCRRQSAIHPLPPDPVPPHTAVILDAPEDSPAITYEWFYRPTGTESVGTAIPDSNHASMTVYPTVDTTYWVVMSDCTETVRSDPYYVRVIAAGAITAQPTSQTVQPGGNAEVGVFIDPPPYSYADYDYEWHAGETPGQDSYALTLGTGRAILRMNVQKNHSLWCKVTHRATGVVTFTNVARIEVACVPIAITGRVEVQTPYVSRTDVATLYAALFTGRAPFTYRWYERYADEATPHILAGRGATYARVMVRPLSYFHATAEDYCGNTVTLDPIAMHLCIPTIDIQPQDRIVGPHAAADLSLTASPAYSGQPLTIKWYRSNDYAEQNVLATGAAFHPVAGDRGVTDSYYAAVEADCDGSPHQVRTRDVSVTACMLTAAGVAQQNIGKGQAATLNVSVSDAAVPASEVYYKWYRGTGANSVLVQEGVGQSQYAEVLQTTAQYWVNVSDGICAVDSNVMTVHVCVPVISAHPQSTVIPQNTTTSLSVSVQPLEATEPFTYQWYLGSTGSTSAPVSGATSATFTTPPLSATTVYWVRVTGQCGARADSNSVTVTVCTPPAITSLSQTQYIRSGASVSIGVNATGSSLSYQWYEGTPGNTSTPVANGTGAGLTVSPAATKTYWVRIKSSGVCAVDSGTVTVDVCTDPVITTQPASMQIRSGNPATLSVVSPTSGVSYQWITAADGGFVQNGTNATLNVTPAADTQYKVRVARNACTTESSTATVTVCAITASLSSNMQNTAKNQPVTLYAGMSASRVDPGATRYTWYRGSPGNWTILNDGNGFNQQTDAPAATTQYYVRVSDGTCGIDSNIVTINVCVPVVATQPVGTTIASGQTASLSLTTSQIPGETVRWYKGARGDTSQPVTNGTSYTMTTQALTATTSFWARVTTSCSTVDSLAATVTVCNPPGVTVTPTRYIRSGEQTSHQVTATGTNLTYQWYAGSPGNTASPIAGATQSSRSLNPTSTTTYWARVTSEGFCSTNSAAMVVDVCTDPVISVQPASTMIVSGNSTTLSVTSSTADVTYQWYFAGSDTLIQGATGSSLSVSPLADTQYYVRLTRGACSINSAPATVTVCALSASVSGATNTAAGQAITLYANASNVRGINPYITWYRGTGASALPIAEGTNLFQKSVSPTTTTQYWVNISDGTCNAPSAAVTVNVCIPTITTQPTSRTINSNQTTTLTVEASGDNLSYRWYIGAPGDTSQPAPGATATTNSYTTPALTATTSYWVRVSGCANRDSVAATVTVCALPSITSGPNASAQRVPNAWGQVSVTATGTSLSYQWYRGQSGDVSQPINGATSYTYSFQLTQSAYFWVRISNSCGSINSPSVLHPVYPVVNEHPDVTVPPNGTPTLSIVATGASLTYQWYRGYAGDESSIITGETSSTYTVPPVTTTVRFWCKVTSLGGAWLTSNTITVSLCEGPAVYGGSYYYGSNTWRVYVNIYTEDIGTVQWYTGTPGNTSQSTERDTGSAIWVSPTQSLVWWARAWNANASCYTDTGGMNIYPVH